MPTLQSWIPPQQNSLIDTFTLAEQLKAQRSANALNDYKIQAYQREAETANRLREAYAGGADPMTDEGARTLLAAGADPKTIYGAQKERFAAQKNQSQTQGFDLENALKQVNLGSQVLSGVRDEGSYQWSRARATKMGLGTEDWPASFDPTWVEQTQAKGMQLKDQIAHQLAQQKEANLQGYRQQQIGISQGHLDVSQANAAESRRHHGVMENRPASGFSMSYDAEGRPVMSYGPGGPKLTEQQGKATSYAIRGGEAHGQLEVIETEGYRPGVGTQLKQWAGGKTGAPDRFLDERGQKYRQAAGIFINAINRQDSGAAIPDVEWERADRLYLVMPGDSEAVIEQKRQARKTALEATGVVAGPGRAALPPSPNLPPTPVALPQRDTAPGPARMEPIPAPQSAEDFARLRSGTRFTDPQGKIRVKP